MFAEIRKLYDSAKAAEKTNKATVAEFGIGSPEHIESVAARHAAEGIFGATINSLPSSDRDAFFASLRAKERAAPFGLNRWDWSNVKCKRTMRRLESALRDRPVEITVDIARTGTAYVTVEWEDSEAYHCPTIRVSDHRCYAGAFSFDGRTDNYTTPDCELRRADTDEDILRTLDDLGIALPTA